MIRQVPWALVALLVATSAIAKERDYCPERPGLGTPACTMAPGRVSVETGLADWTLEQDADTRTDTILFGDTVVRVGLTDTIEAQIEWSPYGRVRERDKTSGAIDTVSRVGDVRLGIKASLHNPDGSGFSAAVEPFMTIPAGRPPVGAGDWGAGVILPVSYDLNDTLNLQGSGELDAAVDEDGHGRHFAGSFTTGLGVKLDKALTGTIELQVTRDDDPSGATTQVIAGPSLGWMVDDDTQLDFGGAAGLDRNAPDLEIYGGISRRF